MSMKAIVATDERGGIGRDGDLAWYCKEDLQLFKEKTNGHIIIMGRKTLESLPSGKPLPNRISVVLTRDMPENPITGVIYMHSVEDVLEFIDDVDSWVIGGSEIYKLFLDHIDEIHETIIEGDFRCDTFFNIRKLFNFNSHRAEFPKSFKGTIAKHLIIWSK